MCGDDSVGMRGGSSTMARNGDAPFTWKAIAIEAVLVATLLLVAVSQKLGAEDQATLLKQAQSLFTPLPPTTSTPDVPATTSKVTLGRMLFFDPRWTVDGNVSCATCHQPALYGSDALARSIGVQHRVHPRNAPTVLNAGLNFVQHWWGDRTSLEDQAERALVGVFSSGHVDHAAVTARIQAIAGYAPLFRQAFPGEVRPITSANIATALSTYERTLVTPAPFVEVMRKPCRPWPRRASSSSCAVAVPPATTGWGSVDRYSGNSGSWKSTGRRPGVRTSTRGASGSPKTPPTSMFSRCRVSG